METLAVQEFLDACGARHKHLCPRQVLGVRIALAGTAALGLSVPRADGRLMVIVETDGCFSDSIEVVTGASVGHRTLRVEDYGKVAATFIDVKAERAVRVVPRADVREKARLLVPEERRRYFTQLRAYQFMEENDLLLVQNVALRQSIDTLIGRAGRRVACARCGEEILNGRELPAGEEFLCRACAGEAYYNLI